MAGIRSPTSEICSVFSVPPDHVLLKIFIIRLSVECLLYFRYHHSQSSSSKNSIILHSLYTEPGCVHADQVFNSCSSIPVCMYNCTMYMYLCICQCTVCLQLGRYILHLFSSNILIISNCYSFHWTLE